MRGKGKKGKGILAYAANKPVRRFATRPPMACKAKISRESSIFSKYFSLVALLQPGAPTTPKMTDDQTGTKPEARVMATGPAMQPEQKRTVDYF